MHKNIPIYSCVAILFVLFICYFHLDNKINKEELMNGNNKFIYINKVTNFKWDYAYLYVDNVDFQKLIFYRNGNKVFSDNLQIDKNGDLISQYLFIGEERDVVYYRCDYNSGKLQFIGKEKLELSGDVIYYYKPVDCIPN